MIQRIQSIFLLLAAGCAFALFAFPFADSNQRISDSAIWSDGIFDIQDHVGLLALFCIAGGLAFISIFLFNNRKNQLLVGRLAVVANILGFVLAMILMFTDKAAHAAQEAAIGDEIGMYLPLLFLIFGLLALRFISKDEKLVRSMDRLR